MFGRDRSSTEVLPRPADPYGRPWDDVPKTMELAERTIRTVRMLRRVSLGPDRVAEIGSIRRFPHPFALSLVRNKQAEPVT